MNPQIFIAAALAVILVVGVVSATAPVFADSNHIKNSNKQNVHVNNHGSGSPSTSGVLTDNDVNTIN